MWLGRGVSNRSLADKLSFYVENLISNKYFQKILIPKGVRGWLFIIIFDLHWMGGLTPNFDFRLPGGVTFHFLFKK